MGFHFFSFAILFKKEREALPISAALLTANGTKTSKTWKISAVMSKENHQNSLKEKAFIW